MDTEGEKHYIAFERKREWVSKNAGGQDERWDAFEEQEQTLEEQYEAEMSALQ